MTRLLIVTLLISVNLTGCRRSSEVTASPPPPLPAVRMEDVASPKEPVVTIGRGSNLRSIAAHAYGHERFSGFVATLNGISDPERIATGTKLTTPSLSVAFRDSEMAAAYQPAVNALAKACTDYYAAEPSYLAARNASGVSRGTFAIPETTKALFIHCADAIDAAIADLQKAKPPHTVPQKALNQFEQVSGSLRELANGSIDGYGYDYDLLGQRMGLGFTNLLIWTRNQHR